MWRALPFPFAGAHADGAGAAERPPSRLAGPGLSAVWAGELEELLRRCDVPRTLIGVLGNTGAGGEERSPEVDRIRG